MPRSTKWIHLSRENKVIYVLTMVALFLLVLGFSTPFWMLISLDTVNSDVEIHDESFNIIEKEYIGLWQWCFNYYGCIDLSLLAKYFSYTKYIRKRNENLEKMINKTSRIISMLT